MFLMINLFSVIHFPWNIVSARNHIPHTESMCTEGFHPQKTGAAALKLHCVDHARVHKNQNFFYKKNFKNMF